MLVLSRGLSAACFLIAFSGCASVAPTPNPQPSGASIALTPNSASAADSVAATGAPSMTPPAAAHHHHDMPGVPPITIPSGALITEADVQFMQGMIAHHAQAVHMTRMADGAEGSARVLKLAQKIDLSQAGEIALMQGWLRAYDQFVPDTSSWRGMSMPGMLSASDLAQLDTARGTMFDKLFLTLMIRHHEGAISMVADLLSSPRAAQEVDISVLANEVETSQLAEIELMWLMLAELAARL
jgi:uncharacterized protein (DUF305 family)